MSSFFFRITKDHLNDPEVYDTIHLGWEMGEITVRNKTIKEAYTRAVELGLKPFKWYDPRSWFQGLWFVTVG